MEATDWRPFMVTLTVNPAWFESPEEAYFFCRRLIGKFMEELRRLNGRGTCRPGALRAIAAALATIETTLAGMDGRIRALQDQVVGQQNRREWYSVSEAAKLLDKAEFTVREWCRLDRINAHKRECGRGGKREWMISHDELERIRQKGLLPAALSANRAYEPSAR